MPSDVEIVKGDWVRFYRGGCLVIAVVEYTSIKVGGYHYLQTDKGEIDPESVLEVR